MSQTYFDVNIIASNVRKKYGCASILTIQNVNNSAWIMENLNSMKEPDIALLAEYYVTDYNIKNKIVERLRYIGQSLN